MLLRNGLTFKSRGDSLRVSRDRQDYNDRQKNDVYTPLRKVLRTFALFLATITLTVAMSPQLAQTDDAQTKYALVIGGASKQAEPEYQEFARNTAAVTEGLAAKGYKVATLFGGPAIQGSDVLRFLLYFVPMAFMWFSLFTM